MLLWKVMREVLVEQYYGSPILYPIWTLGIGNKIYIFFCTGSGRKGITHKRISRAIVERDIILKFSRLIDSNDIIFKQQIQSYRGIYKTFIEIPEHTYKELLIYENDNRG